jgi:phenylacetate-coenzyme A ligase PaaK-like adenylate-forming protein
MIHNLDLLREVEDHHRKNCELYGIFSSQEFPNFRTVRELEDFPFIPVAAFKHHLLKSVPDDEVFRVLSSSGTSGAKSQIYLDKTTARLQAANLAESLIQEFGGARVPMVFVQEDGSASEEFTASKAAMNGFSMMATNSLEISPIPTEQNLMALKDIVSSGATSQVMIFGFTYNIWKLLLNLEELGFSKLLPNSAVLHGGGWKKLVAEQVSQTTFIDKASRILGTSRVTNYYGLVEQTGSIFLECVQGNMHEPNNGAVLIRDDRTLVPVGPGIEGLVQVISSIQKSYPGHSILTEDIGYWLPPSHCDCGNPARILKVIGRAIGAEIRGCSDAQLS